MKYFLNFLLFIALGFVNLNAAASSINAAASTYAFTSTQDAARFSTLTQEVRCVTCQFQNIADSTAPIAASLREKIYRMIQQKKSDEEIKAFLVKRYGEVILLNPRFNPATYLLWLFPLCALLVFAALLRRVYVIK